MAYLSFISDEKLEEIVGRVFRNAENGLHTAVNNLGKNVIDPFSSLLEMSSFEVEKTEWLQRERTRQAQKTFSNHIGHFHQSVLGSIDGWDIVDKNKQSGKETSQIDVVNNEKRIIAEIKNKHNTIKGSNKRDTYITLEDLVMPKGQIYKGYTAYVVAIIPKKAIRYNKEFKPSNSKTGVKKEENELIREIDGYSFYALATGIEDALSQLFDALPLVIKKLKPYYEPDHEFARSYFDKAFMPRGV